MKRSVNRWQRESPRLLRIQGMPVGEDVGAELVAAGRLKIGRDQNAPSPSAASHRLHDPNLYSHRLACGRER